MMIEEENQKTIEKSIEDNESDVDVEDLLMTEKERKLIRKKERQEKKRQKQYNEEEQPEYHKIKKKLDKIPNVYKRDDKSDVEEKVTEQQVEQTLQQNQQQIINFSSQQLQTQNNTPDLIKPKQSHEPGRVIQNQVGTPPMDDSGDVDLNKLFSSEVGNESDVVKELFTQENIKVKTELTKDEVSIISRLELQASMTQNFFLTKVLKELEILRVSKDRKSRTEFVQSFSGIKESQTGVTAFGKLGNIFKNDKV